MREQGEGGGRGGQKVHLAEWFSSSDVAGGEYVWDFTAHFRKIENVMNNLSKNTVNLESVICGVVMISSHVVAKLIIQLKITVNTLKSLT